VISLAVPQDQAAQDQPAQDESLGVYHLEVSEQDAHDELDRPLDAEVLHVAGEAVLVAQVDGSIRDVAAAAGDFIIIR